MSNDWCQLYVLGAPSHFPTEYRHEAAMVSREHRMKRVVQLRDGYQWPLAWECTIFPECPKDALPCGWNTLCSDDKIQIRKGQGAN